MEFEFDKEIDAILRKARENEAVFAAKISEPHLDADVLSAFAENALPEKSKKLYTAHLADCDRCRRILSNLISLNAEEEAVPVKIAETPIVENPIPWYRKLFFGRNLVYTMGALVLAFSAFTGYIVLQNVSSGLSSDISQANTASKSVRGPNAAEEPVFSSNTAPVANMASNISAVPTNPAANANASSMNAATTTATPTISGTTAANQSVAKSAETADRNNLADDAVSGGEKPIDLPSQPLKEETRDLKNESERPKITLAEPKLDEREARKTLPAPPPVAAAEKDEQQDKMVTRSTNKPSPAGAAKMAKKKSDSKTVNGKTFNYENSVWVDSQYRQGSPITNVSRGTDEYRKLDGGLKRIAEQFSETVVVVWKAKTYRIQ